ncbi:LysR substrate-binding domain-containing protein [Kluyvera sp. NPDC087067]|uniref:LysR substrate-binding domain-containing protein n=1 Tax=Kluyvera sp. NPDC087067 TaxID=3364105 RepID=UPI003820F662
MELRHLRYFLAVAEEGHFGRAAKRLNIVQPALSMQIKALEEELGGPLFVRTSRRVVLTDAGRLMQAEAQRTLAQAEHARLTVGRAMRGETGRVRVGFAGNAIFSGQLTADLRRFHQAYPDAVLVINEFAPQQQLAAIASGQLDIGYLPQTSDINTAGMVVQRLGQWEMFVALHDGHPLAAKSSLRVEMLAAQPLILYEAHDGEEQLFLKLSQKLGDHLHVAHRSGSTLSVLAMAATGLGLALVPAPLQQVAIPGLVYRRLEDEELNANLMRVCREQEPNPAVAAYLSLAVMPPV